MTLTSRQQSLLDEFFPVDDLQDRLAAIVDRASRQPRFTATERSAGNRVAGCVSPVWLLAELRDGRCRFRSDADSPVVRGLVALLAEFWSHETPATILAAERDPLELLALDRTLSPTRRLGLRAVRDTMVAFARTQDLPPAATPPSSGQM